MTIVLKQRLVVTAEAFRLSIVSGKCFDKTINFNAGFDCGFEFVYDVGLSDRVIFCGWVNYGDLGSYFQAADIFVLPSFEDTWGAVLLEAMAFGNAVVCSELAGSSEVIVDGKNGFVFNPYDPVELADKLANFFDNPALLSKMSKQSLETISAYNPKDVASFFAQLSESLVKAPF